MVVGKAGLLQTTLRGSQGCHGRLAGNSSSLSSDKHNLSDLLNLSSTRVELLSQDLFYFLFQVILVFASSREQPGTGLSM